MPAVSERQRRFMGAEYGHAKKSEHTETRMSKGQLRDFASKGGKPTSAAQVRKRGRRGHHGMTGNPSKRMIGRFDKKARHRPSNVNYS